MRLATFSTASVRHHVGVVLADGQLVDLTAAGGPPSVRQLLSDADWPAAIPALLAAAPRPSLSQVTLHAPIPNPGKYLAIGLNSRDHRREVNARWLMREPHLVRIAAGYLLAHPRPAHPFFFAKATSSITGPTDPIVLPPRAEKVDWEGELAVIVGAPTHAVSVAEARTRIAGYLIANDVSVRDWQTDNPTSPGLAKGYPSHGPLGPWLVTADEVDPDDMELRTHLNGELRQRGRVADLIHSPAEIISELSNFCLLEPGDVIACGTFAGTGWPQGRFLTPGDTVRITIDGIGELHNPVVGHDGTGPDARVAPPNQALDNLMR